MHNTSTIGSIPAEATANYISKEGERTTIQDIASYVGSIREDLEALKADNPTLAEKIDTMINLVNYIDPDLEACPAPITEEEKRDDARWLLMAAVADAQEILRSESDRQHKEAVAKEAFCMPSGLLCRLIEAIKPELRGKGYPDESKAAQEVVKTYGWDMEYTDNPAYIAKRYAPIRKLDALIDQFPLSPLTAHVLAVLHFAHRWCENTSCNHPSPISGRSDGIARDGVLYPRISMEFHPFKGYREVPKEWFEPLVSKEVAAEAEA